MISGTLDCSAGTACHEAQRRLHIRCLLQYRPVGTLAGERRESRHTRHCRTRCGTMSATDTVERTAGRRATTGRPPPATRAIRAPVGGGTYRRGSVAIARLRKPAAAVHPTVSAAICIHVTVQSWRCRYRPQNHATVARHEPPADNDGKATPAAARAHPRMGRYEPLGGPRSQQPHARTIRHRGSVGKRLRRRSDRRPEPLCLQESDHHQPTSAIGTSA